MEIVSAIGSMLLLANLYFVHEAEAVLNGQDVRDLNEFKYLVAIKTQFGQGRELCGGAILNDFMILTAAHCFVDRSNNNQFADKVIVRGHTFKNQKSIQGIQRDVEKVYMPKFYLDGQDDDIAIVKLRRSLDLAKNSRKLQSVTLPAANVATDNKDAVIAGYGAYKFKNNEPYSDRKLRSLEVTIVPNSQCNKPKARSPLYMCARPKNVIPGTPQGFCDGDSGGPLVVKNGDDYQIVGIIEENEANCDDGATPGLYMRVSRYLNSFVRRVLDDRIDSTIYVKDLSNTDSCNL